jgi:serine/threonine-protein kinase
MRRNTPLITLLTGAALGVVLLVANMLATPSGKPVSYSAAAAAATSAPASATSAPAVATEPSSASPAPAPSSPAPAAPSPTTVTTSPVNATYAGRVGGGGGSVAVSIHDGQAIAYVCNGSTVEAWFKGTAVNGVLIMTGKNNSHFSAIYDFGKVTGDVLAHGTDYSFSLPVVNKPSGLYRATAVVRGAMIKAGWIVLSDGTQVGSVEPVANSPAPSAFKAPELDVATGTARDGNIVLHAVAVDGVTGSGF